MLNWIVLLDSAVVVILMCSTVIEASSIMGRKGRDVLNGITTVDGVLLFCLFVVMEEGENGEWGWGGVVEVVSGLVVPS